MGIYSTKFGKYTCLQWSSGKYDIHFQNEVKQCMRSLVQSLVKTGVFLKFYLT